MLTTLLFILRSRNFSSNSQHGLAVPLEILYCCLYCEAETFQAIHNDLCYANYKKDTVVYTAKQKLFKQFTTRRIMSITHLRLLFILRSRNFSSNSQPVNWYPVILDDCCLYCEAETFQAIHNLSESMVLCTTTVVYTAKQKLFKQFTTITTSPS